MANLRTEWVIFDATGTLLLPKPSAGSVYARAGRAFGSHEAETLIAGRLREAVRRHFAGVDDSLERPATSEANERSRWRRIIADALPKIAAEHRDEVFGQLWRHFAQPEAWGVFEDVEPALIRLRDSGFKIAIASNYDSRLKAVVAGTPSLAAVEHVFTSAEVGFAKPDPRFFNEVSTRLQTDPRRMLMVGDDPLNDIAGARAAGWDAILIDRTGNHPGHDPAVDDLGKLRPDA